MPNLGLIALDFEEYTLLRSSVIGQSLTCFDENNNVLGCTATNYDADFLRTVTVTVMPIAKGASI